MSENKPAQNIWEFTPNFSQMWQHDNNYGYKINSHGIHASVFPYPAHKGKKLTGILYRATVTGFNVPQLHDDTFTSMYDAKAWCQSWIEHFYRRVQLERQVECYSGWLKYYQEELTRVQDRINEEKWEEIRQSFRDVLGSKGGEV